MFHRRLLWRSLVLGSMCWTVSAAGQTPNTQTLARTLVQDGLVRQGDKVLITGSVRDATLLEDIAVEAMRVGASPLITISSDRLTRRGYSEVPASYDNITSPVDMLLVENFDVHISVDVGESESLLADVAIERRTVRAKAAQPVNDAYFKRTVRVVNLGNGLYPTVALARRLAVPPAAASAAFWRAASVSPALLRGKGEALRQAFNGRKTVTLTAPNGTNITLGVEGGRSIISDGALTPEKVKQGSAAAATYLPAGELIIPATNGSANGTVVIDRTLWDGRLIRGLTLTFKDGVLTSMTAANDLGGLGTRYEAARGAKDRFGFIDIGLNPETKLPIGTGRIIWSAPGSVIIGFGDNREFGGGNSSDFTYIGQLANATLTVDGRPVVEKGRLK
jgi:aminopeptidase